MALSVKIFENIETSNSLAFDLSSCQTWEVICPNPTVADSFRENLAQITLEVVVESTTIAKFLSDLFQRCFPEVKVSRKSELLKTLATIWKLKFEGKDPAYFHQSFELFTDLRSFTLDKGLMDVVLEHYHPIVSESVKTFWLILENQGIVDEHQAYSDLYHYCLDNPDVLSEGDLPGFIFSGFSHLSANQIEFMKLLGKFTEVIVPLPKPVVYEAMSTDWVDWVKTQADSIEELPSENRIKNLKVYSFTKGRSNSLIKELERSETFDLILPKKSLAFSEVLKAHTKNLYFKSPSEDLNSVLDILREELTHQFLLRKSEKSSTDEIKDYLLAKVQGKKLASFKDFMLYRVITTFLSEIESYTELSDSNNELGEFDFSVIWEVTQLNLPRNFYLPLLKEVKGHILGLKDLYQVGEQKNAIIVADSQHDLSLGGNVNYPPEVQEVLITLGPIRRQGLDFAFYIYHLRQILSYPNIKLALEEGMLEHDQAWVKILKDFEIENIIISKTEENLPLRELIIPENSNYAPPEKLSASRMQTILDCPKKYYYSYIVGLGQEPDKEKKVDPRILGDVEHECVQEYLDEKSDWDDLFFKELLNQKIVKSFKEEFLLDKLLYEEIYSEIYFYAKQTILEFLKLKKIDPEINFFFERKMDLDEGTGSADVVIESTVLGRLLFDLKRSGGSIPDKYKIQGMRSIQLWYYLYFLNAAEKPFSGFGYINLSDSSNSIIFTLDPEVGHKLSQVDFFKLEKFEKLKEDFSIYIENFYSKYLELKSLVQENKDYPLSPADSQACTFCPGASICSRGQL